MTPELQADMHACVQRLYVMPAEHINERLQGWLTQMYGILRDGGATDGQALGMAQLTACKILDARKAEGTFNGNPSVH